jgi:hypothetical protein
MKMKIQKSEIILFKEDESQELGHKFQYNLNSKEEPMRAPKDENSG